MSKRKYRKGKVVTSLDTLFEHQYFIVRYGGGTHEKTHQASWLRAWQTQMAHNFIKQGAVFVADLLTNGEYYSNKTDDQLADMLDDNLCNYCPLPDGSKGVHCYGGHPVMCEGCCCGDALERWKEEEIEF